MKKLSRSNKFQLKMQEPHSRAPGESAQYDWLKQKADWPSCNDVEEPGKEEALKSKTSKKKERAKEGASGGRG